MSYGKRAAFYGQKTDPNGETITPSDNWMFAHTYDRPSRPSRPVALELREYLSDTTRERDTGISWSSGESIAELRELRDTVTHSCSVVRKKVTRGARLLSIHRMSITAAGLLGVALLVAFVPASVIPVQIQVQRRGAPAVAVAAAVAPAAAPAAPAAVRVAKTERAPLPEAAPQPVAAVPSASAPAATPSSSPRVVVRTIPAPKSRATRASLAAAKNTAKEKDSDKGWTVASATSYRGEEPAAPAATPATATPATAESERAKQDLAAVNMALLNTL